MTDQELILYLKRRRVADVFVSDPVNWQVLFGNGAAQSGYVEGFPDEGGDFDGIFNVGFRQAFDLPHVLQINPLSFQVVVEGMGALGAVTVQIVVEDRTGDARILEVVTSEDLDDVFVLDDSGVVDESGQFGSSGLYVTVGGDPGAGAVSPRVRVFPPVDQKIWRKD